jgi:hypothetical protein
MTISTDHKLIKEKNVDKNVVLRISKNHASGRIFVEFASTTPKMLLQKSFQDTYEGKLQSEAFAKSIKNTEQLLEYFGLNK